MIRKIVVAMMVLVMMSSPAFAQAGRNSMCPVMDGEHVKDKFYVDDKDERVYFCCKSCVKAFKRHPEKYRNKIKQD